MTAVTRAVREFQEAGIFDDCKVTIDEPLPRWLPPNLHGLFATAPQLGWQSHDREAGSPRGDGSNPTLVNNVETLSNILHILVRGEVRFRSMGTAESPWTIVTTVVGDVLAPDVGEVEMGASL